MGNPIYFYKNPMRAAYAILILSMVAYSQATFCDLPLICRTWPLCSSVSMKSTDKKIELSKYMGVWYEQVRIPFFGEKNRCAKATYALDEQNPELVHIINE